MVNQRDMVPGSELRLLDRVMVTDRRLQCDLGTVWVHAEKQLRVLPEWVVASPSRAFGESEPLVDLRNCSRHTDHQS